MNDVATLIYTTSEMERGKKVVKEVKRKDVFCELNSLSLEARSNMQNEVDVSIIKCKINKVHYDKTLTSVIHKETTYNIEQRDVFKASDNITLLLREVM